MSINIDQQVKVKFPELTIFFEIVQNKSLIHEKSLDFKDSILTDTEFEDYQQFRKKASGKSLLAIERLLERGGSLPQPDPITAFVIQASYATRLPITIFCNDGFNSVLIRFSKTGDVLRVNEHDESIAPGLLVADTEHGILGILGVKSSDLGKLNKCSNNLVILSFASSKRVNSKSKMLVDTLSNYFKNKE